MVLIIQDIDNKTEQREQEEFESFICEKLHERGIVVQQIRKSSLYDCGNLLGIDIIYYPLTSKRNGIYIETEKRAFPPFSQTVKSVLFRDSGAWLYGIGDADHFFIFGKKTLRNIITFINKNFYSLVGVEKHETATGKGIFLPFKEARYIAEWHMHYCNVL